MKAVIFGGAGFLGQGIVPRLAQAGVNITVVSRGPAKAERALGGARATVVQWDAETVGGWAKVLDGADLVVNLVGQPIAGGRWTQNYKDALWRSRVHGTRLIVSAMGTVTRPPLVLVQSSAVGYYGSIRGDRPVDETYPPGTDYLARLCSAWEAEALQASSLGVRVVIYRLGVVLHQDGGALKPMITTFRWFLGGPLGSGNQWFPWIHRDDVANLTVWALENRQASGAYNATAPESVTMKEFCRQLGKALGRPCWLPVPKLALKLLLGEGAEAALGGVRAVPARLLQEGYSFLFPDLPTALTAMFGT
jgi:hypothetical protein